MADFPTTDWSLLSRAQHAGTLPDPRGPVAELIGRYVPAMRRYLVRGRRLNRDAVDDLIQSFVVDRMLDRRLLAAADRGRGSFRNLLVRALENYVIDSSRRANVRSGVNGSGTASAHDDVLSAGIQLPVEQFEREWARSVLQEAVQRTFDHYQRRKRDDLWQILRTRIIDPAADGAPVPPYSELVERFGFATPAEASNALIAGKRMFMRKLTEVLVEQAGPGADAAEELADLRRIISR